MTNNPYIKQFPELFTGKTIMYVHGFASSGQSGTVNRLRQVLPEAKIVAPDLPIHPAEALDLLRATCEQERPSLIIGTSMGGMYAEQLYGFDRILTNPAFQIGDTMQNHGLTGKQQFFSPRKDGVQDFYVDKSLVKEYRQATEHNFEHAADEGEAERVFGLFGDEDKLVHTYDLFRQHYPQAVHFHGEHRMDDRSFMHSVLPVIRWIDDRQEKRERPVCHITIDALRDERGQQRSAAMKALRMLIEHYQVYIIAPTDDCDFANNQAVQEWCQQNVGVPAFKHLVFTRRRDLLYGDYLVSTDNSDRTTDFMGTRILLGSDEMKTWEELIVFFSRLGGQ